MTAPYPDAQWPCRVAFHRGDDEPCDSPGCWLRSNEDNADGSPHPRPLFRSDRG